MVLTTVMTSQLENQQSIEQEILMDEKSKETSHPDISPEIQEVLDAIQDVPIAYLSLIKEFTWKQIKEMMEVLFVCSCCERHQKNKPHISDLENGHRGDYPPSNRKISEDDCQCVCRQEARDFCRIINDPDYFDLYYGRVARYSSPVNENYRDDSDENSEFLEPDVGYSNIYHRDIELGCMCEDCLKEEHKEDKYENRCIECGVDMGLENPRQLCGKTYCRNITERDDDGSIS
jgi:hypothetical protein